jgi:thiamine pyrophosphate-dependent acetolactate synthase large subunit-like protein
MLADRVTFEVSRFADKDAIVVHEAGSVVLHGFDFDANGGRELFFYYGAHLGSGVGTAAGVKLARPNRQVICLVGDGSFVFGPTALWNMARLELPVITVVYKGASSCTTTSAARTWTWRASPRASGSKRRSLARPRSCARRSAARARRPSTASPT